MHKGAQVGAPLLIPPGIYNSEKHQLCGFLWGGRALRLEPAFIPEPYTRPQLAMMRDVAFLAQLLVLSSDPSCHLLRRLHSERLLRDDI